jgi:outer membrane protein insertion porin family
MTFGPVNLQATHDSGGPQSQIPSGSSRWRGKKTWLLLPLGLQRPFSPIPVERGVYAASRRAQPGAFGLSFEPVTLGALKRSRSLRDCARSPKRVAAVLVLVQLLHLLMAAPGFGAETTAKDGKETPEVKATKAEEPAEPARVRVSGRGFFGNRNLLKTLNVLKEGNQFPEFLDANLIEDAALILLARLREQGFLKARIQARVELADGSTRVYDWERGSGTLVDRPTSARSVRYHIQEGKPYYYRQIDFEGLTGITPGQARRYFVEMDSLIPLKSTRVYSPESLEESLSNLREVLLRQGYENASVTTNRFELNPKTGAVRLTVRVVAGLKVEVRDVIKQVQPADAARPLATSRTELNVPYSWFWLQDYRHQLQAEQYAQGYPDATADLSVTNRHQTGGIVLVDVLARIKPGPRVRLGKVAFEGDKKTRASILHREVDLMEGDDLNRIEVERMRNKLARLGVFDTVDFRYEPVDDRTRNVTYELKESRLLDLSLLFGYGSYELLRGGFELDQHNLFGLAHHARLRAIQSFKATSADYYYTMPSVIGEDVNLFFNASFLRRKEVSFDREEVEGGMGVKRFFPSWATETGLRYDYQILNANNADVSLPPGVQRARVGAFILDFKHDRRDNPLLPRKGYKTFLTFEEASQVLGGEVDYQRLEANASVHLKVGNGRYLHLGLSHGAIFTLGGTTDDLPFNKRFFPGGENSIRGYQQGEASPLDADGNIVGAETYLLGNADFEQILTPSWSVVVFVDGLGEAQDIKDYPFEEILYSAGGGIHWNTIIGPVRLEYGYNLKRRHGDPSGTLHLTIGFPF